MIHFFATGQHAYTFRWFLEDWAPGLRKHAAVIPYENVGNLARLGPGLFVFADLERLQPGTTPMAVAVHRRLVDADQGSRVLNDPARSLRRTELLEHLHGLGRNRFAAYRLGEVDGDLRYPVFIRDAHDHEGPISNLLRDESALRRAVFEVVRKGIDPDRLLVVEFCDVMGPDDLRRKYGAFRIGARVIPGHVVFGRRWNQKWEDVVDGRTSAEERAFIEDNPHRSELMEIFQEARIDYGRIDYGILDGQIQVWEINTNPVLLQRRREYHPARLPGKQRLAAQLQEALVEAAKVECPIPAGGRVDTNFSFRELFGHTAGR